MNDVTMPRSIGTRSVADPEITKGGGGTDLGNWKMARAQSAPKFLSGHAYLTTYCPGETVHR